MSLTFDLTVRNRLDTALHWWLGGLAALLPEGVRSRFSPAGRSLVLAIDGDTVVALQPAGGQGAGKAATLPQGGGAVPPAFAQTLDRARRGRIGVAVHLPQRCGLRSRMRLPLAAEENLREVISFELDRQTPFKPEQVFFTYRVAERDVAAARLLVDLTVVPRPVVEAALEMAARLGLAPEAVEIAEAAGAGGGNLLPAEMRPRRRLARFWPLVLAGGVVVLVVGAAVFEVERTQSTLAALQDEVAAARKDADAGLRLRDAITRTTEEGRFLVTRKRAQPAVSVVLYELTRLLPDDAWLSDLQIAGSEIQAVGSAASATAVIERLNKSSLFADAGFRSPVTRDSQADREAFNISMHIVVGTTP